MKKTFMKKSVAWLLTLVMIIGFTPSTGFAAGALDGVAGAQDSAISAQAGDGSAASQTEDSSDSGQAVLGQDSQAEQDSEAAGSASPSADVLDDEDEGSENQTRGSPDETALRATQLTNSDAYTVFVGTDRHQSTTGLQNTVSQAQTYVGVTYDSAISKTVHGGI